MTEGLPTAIVMAMLPTEEERFGASDCYGREGRRGSDGDLEMAAVGSDCGSKRVRDGKKVMAEGSDCSRGGREVASSSPLGRMMLPASIFFFFFSLLFFVLMKTVVKMIAARRQGRQMEIAAAIEGSGWEMATVGGSNNDDDDGDGSVDGKGSSYGTARTSRIAALIPIDRTV
ncbi:hypothetical protein B296_00003130 [Ensete ventricosum]|uniref:Uncharacterized protein n=1 Tax=Ensete ventricosum TaxID=4639 RepID=A0A426ZLL9_ENSVE|nr:hypothetical protein B296_00003130 [Ensete ventricosum]